MQDRNWQGGVINRGTLSNIFGGAVTVNNTNGVQIRPPVGWSNVDRAMGVLDGVSRSRNEPGGILNGNPGSNFLDRLRDNTGIGSDRDGRNPNNRYIDTRDPASSEPQNSAPRSDADYRRMRRDGSMRPLDTSRPVIDRDFISREQSGSYDRPADRASTEVSSNNSDPVGAQLRSLQTVGTQQPLSPDLLVGLGLSPEQEPLPTAPNNTDAGLQAGEPDRVSSGAITRNLNTTLPGAQAVSPSNGGSAAVSGVVVAATLPQETPSASDAGVPAVATAAATSGNAAALPAHGTRMTADVANRLGATPVDIGQGAEARTVLMRDGRVVGGYERSAADVDGGRYVSMENLQTSLTQSGKTISEIETAANVAVSARRDIEMAANTARPYSPAGPTQAPVTPTATV